MTVVGQVHSLWRYPVKSMRGEQLEEAFAGFAGIYGDRLYAFHSSAAPAGFPYLTGREQGRMLLCRPIYRHPHKMRQPPNLADAAALPPGATPIYASADERGIDVETSTGDVFAIDDPGLIRYLRDGMRERHELTLMQSDRSMTDCRPVSIFSTQTARQLSDELGFEIDMRRFRANVYVELKSGTGFAEDQFIGRTLRIGDRACVAVTDRDPRCKMITLDPETAEPNPEVMRQVAHAHDGKAGVYGAVVVEGLIRPGDEIVQLS
jgi:uncharacterized protein YcbX